METTGTEEGGCEERSVGELGGEGAISGDGMRSEEDGGGEGVEGGEAGIVGRRGWQEE